MLLQKPTTIKPITISCFLEAFSKYQKGRAAIGTNGSYYPYQGDMDDIGFWDRTLTQQEITNLYNASTPPPCNPLASNLMSGLVGYWPFCGNANDESGNGNNGTVNGATLTNDRFGNMNAAYSFDGVDDFIQCLQSGPTGVSSITVTFWTKNIGSGSGHIVSWGNNGNSLNLKSTFTITSII